MDILKAGKKHFADKLQEDLQSIEVPEWLNEEGKPFKIYFRSSLRLSQKGILLKHYQNEEYDKAIACQLIFRAKDQDGKPLFKMNQMDQIIDDLDPDVCSKIVSQMDNALPSVEEIKGN
tara:strand:+ start:163 stop:519 length:357 start_codon:yes stop_codon:yes gene_type:complete